MNKIESIYQSIRSMEPMLPVSGGHELAELSVKIFAKAGELKASLPSRVVRRELAGLVKGMNSYYSNLIEGHKTLPRDIEKALQEDFSDKEALRNQRMSVAHIAAENAMRDLLSSRPETDVFAPEFIAWLHQEFYRHLPEEEWFTTSQSGKKYRIEPGRWRDHNVDVGRHIPPDHPVVGEFLSRFHAVYKDDGIYATNRLVALSAAHHRLAWIHPFGDGNGRVARLHSQSAMIQAGIDGDGLWTLSRGLARSRSRYYSVLQSADQQRHGDLDGRGNLSDKGLSEFCLFFLSQMLDQIEFMIGLISPLDLQKRIENYLRYERVDLSPKKREQFGSLLKVMCLQGEVARGEAPKILGLKETAARGVVRDALQDELIAAKSEKGALRIAFPNKVVDSYFPQLFRDLPVDD